MDDLAATHAALSRAIDDVQVAIAKVRHAQEVDWRSVFATRYREELYATIQDLTQFRDRLSAARDGVA
ncbi:hypothetical protein [Demequina sp.]|uniref:hypothetical protein n=1 Tax=Demequina sp. TaxID=2050685 RepID=UPI003D0AD2D9